MQGCVVQNILVISRPTRRLSLFGTTSLSKVVLASSEVGTFRCSQLSPASGLQYAHLPRLFRRKMSPTLATASSKLDIIDERPTACMQSSQVPSNRMKSATWFQHRSMHLRPFRYCLTSTLSSPCPIQICMLHCTQVVPTRIASCFLEAENQVRWLAMRFHAQESRRTPAKSYHNSE